MKFYDHVTIEVTSGRGGDGIVSGRREKNVPHGGPAGGDGGAGGSVIFIGSDQAYTLMPYRMRQHYAADNGNPGQSKEKYGKGSDDMLLPVPLGTLIKDANSGDILAHITEQDQQYIACKGGRGGVGNMHFASSTRQFPNIALFGEPGQKRRLTLELQLLGDVALIGTPSVGKSTLINAVTKVRAKTAEYHFTTLVPNLGVVQHKNQSFTIVDVPGLIEGAHTGKGLGNVFLRHILKARIFAIMVDMSKEDQGIGEFGSMLDEILQYIEATFVGMQWAGIHISEIQHNFQRDQHILRYRATATHQGEEHLLFQKGILLVANKYDLYDDVELWQEYKKNLYQHVIEYIANFGTPSSDQQIDEICVYLSAATQDRTDFFLDKCLEALSLEGYTSYTDHENFALATPLEPYINDISEASIPDLLEQGYINEMDAKYVGVREVYHPEVARLIYMLPWGNDEAELWFWQIMEREGHLKWLGKAGARKGDILKVVSPYEGVQERYILWD